MLDRVKVVSPLSEKFETNHNYWGPSGSGVSGPSGSGVLVGLGS